jgi:hypothetical protein
VIPEKNATTRTTVARMITHPYARLLAVVTVTQSYSRPWLFQGFAFKNSVEIDKDAFLDRDGKSGEWWALSL